MHVTIINAFLETGVNDSYAGALGITDKAVLTAFPGCGFHAVIVAIDVLIKGGTISRKKRVIVRGQNKIETLASRRSDCHWSGQNDSKNNGSKEQTHGR
jgi:hypothetical protein